MSEKMIRSPRPKNNTTKQLHCENIPMEGEPDRQSENNNTTTTVPLYNKKHVQIKQNKTKQ